MLYQEPPKEFAKSTSITGAAMLTTTQAFITPTEA